MANQPVPGISTMDGAFAAATKLAEKEVAKYLIAKINRLAKTFVMTKVEATEAPIVVPE